MSDQKIITTQDILNIHAEQLEEYRQEWQEQEEAKNAWAAKCKELQVDVERLKKIVATERRTATEFAEQLRRIEAILNE